MQQRSRVICWNFLRGIIGIANAYRGELLGLMAIHLILLSMNKIYSNLPGSMEIISDCLGALKQVTYLPPYRIPSCCRHSDILKTILVHRRGLSFTTYYSHVKAHQDDMVSFVEVCPYRDLSLGYRDPYIGILVPTCDPLPKGTLGNLVLHRNM